MTQAFLKPLSWNESQSIGKSLKKEINWCLNHVNILGGSKVMTKNRHQNMYICIFFGPIYQNDHQIVTTSSSLLALRHEFHTTSLFPTIKIIFFNWIFFLVILPIFHVSYLLYKFMSIQVNAYLNLYWMLVSFSFVSIGNTHIFNNMLFESSLIYDHPII
jgi:hypothetical protein